MEGNLIDQVAESYLDGLQKGPMLDPETYANTCPEAVREALVRRLKLVKVIHDARPLPGEEGKNEG